MSILNQGRNEIRFNNSDGKCLLENWVEERQVKEYDTIPDAKGESSAKIFRDGHAGILSTDFDATAEKNTTFRVSYKSPEYPGVRLMGKKEDLMRQMYMEQVVQDVFKDDINPPQPEPTDFRSVTMADYNKPEFKHVPPAPTKIHLNKAIFIRGNSLVKVNLTSTNNIMFYAEIKLFTATNPSSSSLNAMNRNSEEGLPTMKKGNSFRNHNYRTEQPVTFWSEHKDKVTGVTNIKTGDTPFRKNNAFSQPIEEYFDDTQPYDQENYPKM